MTVAIPQERLRSLIRRHEAVAAMLSAGHTGDDYVRLSREFAELDPVAEKARALSDAEQELRDTEALIADPVTDREMRALAEDERRALAERIDNLRRELRVLLIPRDAADDHSAILEVRAGTGGDEAGLFAGDLFRMYERYAALHGWKIEVLSASEGEAGGYKEIVAAVRGGGVYGRLKFESGVHRVQRVPTTEASGRIHTSAATVAVLPEAKDVDIEIRPEDLSVETLRASSKGGQHANTTSSAIRMTHIPTGITVAVSSRSQHQNRAQALEVLRSRLYEAEREKLDSARSSQRKDQVGSGDRSERIRTYNFPQGRVTEHRINLTLYRLDRVLDGSALDEIVDALVADDQAGKLSQFEDTEVTSFGAALGEARAALRAAGVENAGLDVRLLLSAAAGVDLAGLISRTGEPLPNLAEERFRSHMRRRLAGEPVARILDGAEFWALHIRLNAATLVPRPDTEVLVATALEEARRSLPPDITICDLGTGCGAIVIALLRELPEARAMATDISGEALAMARENAEQHGVLPRLALQQSSFADGPKGSFDLVVANPPYIRSDAIPRLQREVRDHDPHAALDGGADGLEAYRAILARAGTLVSRRGFLAFEVGYDQADSVMRLCRQAGLPKVIKIRDLADKWRVVLGTWDGSERAPEGSKKALGKVG